MGTVVNSVTYPGDAVLIDVSASDAASAAGAGAQNDHGGLSGLLDDDHTQYLNETRHDALSADNPHSVTFTQAVTADAGTNITAAEAETLTDTSNADLLHGHDHDQLTNVHQDVNTTAAPEFVGLNFATVASLPALVIVGKVIRLVTDNRLYYGI